MTVFQIIILLLSVEAITELVSTSTIFFSVRDRISRFGENWAVLIHCGYCLSVHISIFVYILSYYGLWWVLYILALHRGSNIIHDIIKRIQSIPRT